LATALGDTSAAAPAPPYAELLRRAVSDAPRVQEGDANLRAAQGLARQASTLPNPTVGVEVENLGVHDVNGLSQRQTTVSVSQPLELGGKRSARAAAGRAEVDVAQARARQARADLAYDLAFAYATAETANRRVKLLKDDLDRAREDLRAALALVDAGKEADQRAVQARASVSAAEADLQAAQADATEALARLSSLAGSEEAYTSVPDALLSRAEGLAANSMGLPTDAPGVQVAEAEREAAARKIRVERARAAPDVTVSLGARRIDGLGGTAVVAGVSAPLPLFDRNRGAVDAANAQLNAAEARLRGARLDAEANWRAAAAQANAGQARLRAALDAAAAAREGYQLTRVGYEAGKTSLIELLNARRALTEAEARLLDARLARIRAEATLARLAGRLAFGE
jgi:cobalt-zinc-cadmium efflux system outer membrane protein